MLIRKIAFVTVSILFLMPVLALAQDTVKRVFLVASYGQNNVCGWPQEEGVIGGLNKEGWFEGINLQVERYYMNTKKRNTTPAQMRTQGRLALDKIKAFSPDVVVTLDDNAFREVGLALNKSSLPVVFSGMNGQPEAYNKKQQFMRNRLQPGGNITGVYEKLYVVRSLQVMAAALPTLKGKKVVGITDYTPTGNAITRQLELELAELELDVGWEQRRVHDWQEYQDLITELNLDSEVVAIYPVAVSLKDEDKKIVLTAPEIFAWTTANSTKPEVAVNYFFSKIGLFGGAAVDFKAMGAVSGHMAGKILAGVPAGSLAIVDAPDYAIVFNLKRARELGISIPAPLLTAADHVYR